MVIAASLTVIIVSDATLARTGEYGSRKQHAEISITKSALPLEFLRSLGATVSQPTPRVGLIIWRRWGSYAMTSDAMLPPYGGKNENIASASRGSQFTGGTCPVLWADEKSRYDAGQRSGAGTIWVRCTQAIDDEYGGALPADQAGR